MRVSVDDIIETVCRFYRLDKAELLGPAQDHLTAHPRQAAWSLARDFTAASPGRLALRFKRDRKTVIVGLKNHNQRCRDMESVAYDYAHISRKLGAYHERMCYCEAWEQAWRTWEFIHRPQFVDRPSPSPLHREQRPAP